MGLIRLYDTLKWIVFINKLFTSKLVEKLNLKE